MVSEKITKFINRTSVFKDRSILENGHDPHTLDGVLDRDDKINESLFYLQPALYGKVPENILIYGTFGVGKSMLTKLITNEIVAATNNKIITVYTPCSTFKAKSAVLRQINRILIERLNCENKSVGIAIDRNFVYFAELVNEANIPIILIFDEIDLLKEPDMVNEISRMKEDGFTGKNVCIIGITNNTQFKSTWDGRTLSVFGHREIFIDPYNAEQLIDILNARVKLAFCPNSLDEIVVKKCAALGAQEKGDARLALDLLRSAGDEADKRESNLVEEKDVDKAKDNMEIDRQLKVVRSLPTQTKAVLFAALHKYDKLGINLETLDIYNAYVEICKMENIDTLKPRRINDYIGELNTLGIISVNKISRGRKRGVFNSIKPLIDTTKAELLIVEDYRFPELRKRYSESLMNDFDL